MGEISVYISGPLTAAADLDGARAYYLRIASVCTGLGWTPYLPHMENDPQLHPDVAPEEVFRRDSAKLLGSDLVVACVGAPSLGVGAEVAMAIDRGIPVLAVYRPNERVSRFILGMLAAPRGLVLELDDESMQVNLPPAMQALVGETC